MFSHYSGIKLENRNVTEKFPNTWKLSKILLKNSRSKGNSRTKYKEQNENKSTV